MWGVCGDFPRCRDPNCNHAGSSNTPWDFGKSLDHRRDMKGALWWAVFGSVSCRPERPLSRWRCLLSELGDLRENWLHRVVLWPPRALGRERTLIRSHLEQIAFWGQRQVTHQYLGMEARGSGVQDQPGLYESLSLKNKRFFDPSRDR